MRQDIPIENSSVSEEDGTGTATSNGGADAGADTGEVARDMTALEAQRERYLRLAADYDNFRKRTARDAIQERARGQGELIKAILNSLDDLDRFGHLDPDATEAATVIDGVAMIERNIQKALAGTGVEIVDPLELPFDPNLHEAVSTQAAETPDEDHMVAQVYQRGYMLNGQLLRPARVVVKQYQ